MNTQRHNFEKKLNFRGTDQSKFKLEMIQNHWALVYIITDVKVGGLLTYRAIGCIFVVITD